MSTDKCGLLQRMTTLGVWASCLGIALCLTAAGRLHADDLGEAQRLINTAGVQAGLCVHLGATDGQFTAELGRSAPFVVHALTDDRAGLEAARAQIRAQGLYGRVSLEYAELDKLPYADSMVNLLVMENAGRRLAAGTPPLEEVQRVLAPGGVACLQDWTPPDGSPVEAKETVGRWTLFEKGYPEGGDEWTHFNYDTSANRVSKDVLVEPFQRLRWVAGVEWQMPDYFAKSSVVGGGRMYYVINEHPVRRRSWRYLSVRDAFSGVLLWKRTPAPGPLTLIADGPRFFMESEGRMVMVDGETGRLLKTYGEAFQPGWAYLHDGHLLVSCMERGPRRGELRKIDVETGELRWSLPDRNVEAIRDRNNAAIDGNRVLYVEGHRRVTRAIGCVNWQDGEELWHRPIGDELGVDGAITLSAFGEGVMIISSGSGIHAFSAEDGRHLWDHTYERIGTPWRRKAKSYRDVFVIDGLVWVHVGDLQPELTENPRHRYLYNRTFYWQGLDPNTGREVRRISYPEDKTVGASCFPDQATTRYFMGGYSDFVEIARGEYQPKARALKTSCGIGPRPAYGLLYNTTLYQPGRFLQGTMALEHGGPDTGPAADDPARLVTGDAAGRAIAGQADPEDWPMYRYDALRTARSPTRLSPNLKELWAAEVGAEPSAPTAARGRVFVAATDSHEVVAFDAENGGQAWRFTAGSRVRQPPSYTRGLAVFGSADGRVVALDAETGGLAWQFAAARTPRRIVARERVESVWPVDQGVLPVGESIFFVAGRHGEIDGGLDYYALNAADGRLVWHRNVGGECPYLPISDGQTVTLGHRGIRFDVNDPEAQTPNIRIHSDANKSDELYPPHILDKTAALTIRLKALIVAGELVFAAGRPLEDTEPSLLWRAPTRGERSEQYADIPDYHPLDPPDEKPDWYLYAFSIEGGEKLGEMKLPAEPVWDGMAAARGRLYLTTTDGMLRCFVPE